MELQKAISQISEIHAQVLRSEVFRGCRALPMAVTSLLALTAATAQTTVLRPADLVDSLWLWIGYAVLCAFICGADLVLHCWVRDRRFRQQAGFVVAQFVPAVVAGVLLTAVLIDQPANAHLLPGLWTAVFALGIFSARPYLPRALGWVAAFYLAAGAFLLWSADTGTLIPAWSMGLTFGAGQAAAAYVLHDSHGERPSGSA